MIRFIGADPASFTAPVAVISSRAPANDPASTPTRFTRAPADQPAQASNGSGPAPHPATTAVSSSTVEGRPRRSRKSTAVPSPVTGQRHSWEATSISTASVPSSSAPPASRTTSPVRQGPGSAVRSTVRTALDQAFAIASTLRG